MFQMFRQLIILLGLYLSFFLDFFCLHFSHSFLSIPIIVFIKMYGNAKGYHQPHTYKCKFCKFSRKNLSKKPQEYVKWILSKEISKIRIFDANSFSFWPAFDQICKNWHGFQCDYTWGEAPRRWLQGIILQSLFIEVCRILMWYPGTWLCGFLSTFY